MTETHVRVPVDDALPPARRDRAPARAARRRRRLRFDRHILPVLLLAPLLAIIVGVVGYPIVSTVRISFYNGEYLRTGDFVGFGNYTDIFGDTYFRHAVVRTIVFAVISVTAIMVVSLLIALVLDSGPRFGKLLTVFVLLPWAMPRVASGIVWKWMFNDQYGVVNWALGGLGLSRFNGYPWFNHGYSAMAAIIVSVVWHSIPFIAISMVAGLRATRGEVLEAAKIDGASPFRALIHVRLPMMRPLLTILVLMSTIFAFQSFDAFIVMTTPPGGPNHGTEVLSLLTWLQAFAILDQGKAAAMAIVVFVILASITAVYIRLRGKEGEL